MSVLGTSVCSLPRAHYLTWRPGLRWAFLVEKEKKEPGAWAAPLQTTEHLNRRTLIYGRYTYEEGWVPIPGLRFMLLAE